ncbi:MAG: hypothetical protein RMZ43_036065, partial [Nostoc sp. CmiVER01]|uniref:hypothetical protein n=1 Tax=Nostoc sp. CmiVER01 TaxID=3075384 RepID=UPI003D160BC2
AGVADEPSFGYRTVAGLMRINKDSVRRIFQLKGWQVRTRAAGRQPPPDRDASFRPPPLRTNAELRICAESGMARGEGLSLALVIDGHTRQLLD